MNIALFEDVGYRNLLPLTWLRACFELRCGRDSLLDKIQTHLPHPVARFIVRHELRPFVEERLRSAPASEDHWCLLNARAFVTGSFDLPQPGVVWKRNGTLVAATVSREQLDQHAPGFFLNDDALAQWIEGFRTEYGPEDDLRLIEHPWELALACDEELRRQCTVGGKHEGTVHPGAHLVKPESIAIEPGAVIKPGVVLDADDGPIHIERDAQIQPNAVVLGPCFIGRGSIIRPGSVIREGTSIGPVCKVGGEIESTIFHGYANKQHDGFLGHSYVGQWVNLGADTVTSDLKNTYGTIRVSINGVGVETGQHFVGSIIGDHAKTGIGTILPTGCVLGVGANVFTQKPVPKFVPSFAWLTDQGMSAYRLEKAIHIARIVMSRRDVHLSDAEVALLEEVARAARDVESAGWPDSNGS